MDQDLGYRRAPGLAAAPGAGRDHARVLPDGTAVILCATVAVKTVVRSMSAGWKQNPVTIPSSRVPGKITIACEIPVSILVGFPSGPGNGSVSSSRRRTPTAGPWSVGNASTSADACG